GFAIQMPHGKGLLRRPMPRPPRQGLGATRILNHVRTLQAGRVFVWGSVSGAGFSGHAPSTLDSSGGPWAAVSLKVILLLVFVLGSPDVARTTTIGVAVRLPEPAPVDVFDLAFSLEHEEPALQR